MVYGGDGDDTLVMKGTRVEKLSGDAGDDRIQVKEGFEASSIYGGDGDDDITIESSYFTSFDPADNTTSKLVDGGDGDDTIKVIGGYNYGIFGGAGDDAIITEGDFVNKVYGGDGDDTIAATGLMNFRFYGGAGDDDITINTDYGDELVAPLFETGDDTIVDKLVDGGDGDDTIAVNGKSNFGIFGGCLLYTSPSPRDQRGSRMPSSA